MEKGENTNVVEYGSKESILESLVILRDRVNSVYDYIFFKGNKSEVRELISSIKDIEFWSCSTKRQLLIFLDSLVG